MFLQGKCQRKDPPCKYLHPPQHLKEQLLQNGRNNLILKNLQMQAFAASVPQVMPGVYPTVVSIMNSDPPTPPWLTHLFTFPACILSFPSCTWRAWPTLILNLPWVHCFIFIIIPQLMQMSHIAPVWSLIFLECLECLLHRIADLW